MGIVLIIEVVFISLCLEIIVGSLIGVLFGILLIFIILYWLFFFVRNWFVIYFWLSVVDNLFLLV